MMARWMLAATAFGILISLAAFASNLVQRARGRSTRGLWTVALGLSVAWPVAAAFLLQQQMAPATVMLGDVVAVGAPAASPDAPRWVITLPTSGQINTALSVLWAIASLLLLTQAGRAVLRLRRIERSAVRATIAGESVLVSERLGPAVFGLVTRRVVVPAWLLDLDASLQSMVLRHEREHCDAGDPWLVWLAVIATIAMPWNVAVWWLAARLRLAMELDCDARTLRALPDRGDAYARLLLLIAQRTSGARFVAALAHSPSQLARRIAAMTSRSVISRMQLVGAYTLIAVAVAAACSGQVAGNLAGPATLERQQVADAAVVTSRATPTELPSDLPYFDFQVERAVFMLPGARGPEYPSALRAARMEGMVIAQFVVNVDGAVDMSTFKVVSSSDSAFSEAVRAAMPSLRYAPALVGDKAVRQLVQTPFTFTLSNDDGATNVRVGMTPEGQTKARRSSDMTSGPTLDPRATHESMVDRRASLAPGFKGPVYPAALRAEQVEGRVLIQIIVNADGSADMASFKVLESDHQLFTEAVKTALAAGRFSSATVQGKAVRELMLLPFEFVPRN